MTINHYNLGDLISPATVDRAGTGDYPILSMTMHHGLVLQGEKFKKRVASADTSAYKVVKRGQLVVGFPVDEGVLAFQEITPVGIVSPAYDVWNINTPQLVQAKYLERFLRSPIALSYYRSKLRSTTARRRSLPQELFLTLQVPILEISEQKRVANILDQVDSLREKRIRSIVLLHDLAQSIFLEFFSREMSDSWPTASLSEVVSEGTIVTYGIVQAGDECPGGVPYIRTGDIRNGCVAAGNLRHTSAEIAAKFIRSRVEEDDIVMSIRATVGTTALIDKSLSGANLTQGTARISPGKRVTPLFLLNYLRSTEAQRWIQRRVKGATFREITLAMLRQLPVLLPPLSLQERFSELIGEIEEAQRAYTAHSGLLDELFASLQARAFRNEL